jgi:serine/threonine protein phosphatase 1
VGSIVLLDTGACYGGQLTAYCPETRQTRRVSALPALPAPLEALAPASGLSCVL